ncbi:MAG: DUF1028 domain-containing protein [Nitrospinota bacterium]|nr:MAG: DUF1028 domain-containing protein [Nitrospinota bacterium]
MSPFVPGPVFTTFSIVGRCARTGMLGIGIATRSMAVGARCVYARASVGAVASQASTDPRLGLLGLRLLEMGYSAPKVLAELVSSDPHIAKRQLGIVDKDGHAVAYTGAENREWCGHQVGENYAAIANMVANDRVVPAMVEAFTRTQDEPLEERLLKAIEAGHAAGGQAEGEHSAALYVVDREVFARVDLRVDEHPEAVAELRRIFELYKPLITYFAARPANPYLPSPEAWMQRQ